MYSQWATTTLDSKSLVITPFIRLPSERKANPSEADIHRERVIIRDTITNRPNYELEHDEDAMALVHKLGSDLMINPFACNFHVGGNLNADVVEASFLNRRLYQRLSITSMDDVLNQKPIVIMGTEFSQKKYGKALSTFKKRLGLIGEEDLYALSNVSMSPWPTAGQFLHTIVDDFKRVAEEEIKVSGYPWILNKFCHELIPHSHITHRLVLYALKSGHHSIALPSMELKTFTLFIWGHLMSLITRDRLLWLRR